MSDQPAAATEGTREERVPRCPKVDETSGHPCQKPLIRLSDGTHDHAGGHWFASDRTQRLLDEGHYDAGALLRGEPVSAHLPANCPGPPACLGRP